MNNNGQIFDVARKSIYWIIAGFLIVAVVGLVAFTLANYQGKLTRVPPQLSAEFITLRFTNLPECFAAVDKNTGMVQTGSIDTAKFNQETLNRCYSTETEKGFKTFNFRFKLASSGQELMTNNYYYHDRNSLTLRKDVLAYKEGTLIGKDQLIIYVQEKI